MAKVRVKLNNRGFQQLRQHPAVQADMLRRSQAIAAAAGSEKDYATDSHLTKTRSRASVRTISGKARHESATDNTLLRALDAGRG